MTDLSIVTLFCRDIGKVGDFFCDLFDLTDGEGRTETFRPLRAGPLMIALSDWSVYAILGLDAPHEQGGDAALLTFDAGSRDDLHDLFERAKTLGAVVVKDPFVTSYGWYQAVIRDPEGHPVRLNFPG